MTKVRTKPVVEETVHNQGLGGVKVTIQLHTERGGVDVVISLPGACAWQGRMLDRVQRFVTDEAGRVVVMLPPSDEIKPLSPRNRVPVPYKMECVPVGTLTFEVPNLPEWTLGA
jgi:hypothetical protein